VITVGLDYRIVRKSDDDRAPARPAEVYEWLNDPSWPPPSTATHRRAPRRGGVAAGPDARRPDLPDVARRGVGDVAGRHGTGQAQDGGVEPLVKPERLDETGAASAPAGTKVTVAASCEPCRTWDGVGCDGRAAAFVSFARCASSDSPASFRDTPSLA
jgi:hypothetical protein